jgi:hypothetical protein
MKHVRTHTLSFEAPRPDSDVVIRAELHEVTEEGKTVTFISGTTNEIFRRLSEVSAEFVAFTDPVTQQQHTISLVALAGAVTESVRAWMIDDIPGGRFDENKKYVIEE